MAHFAEIDSNNIVQRVIVVDDSLEQDGAAWCSAMFGGTWLQTSYNGTVRRNFAGVGFTYDPTRDAFIPPQPFPSWTLNDDSLQWVPPDGWEYPEPVIEGPQPQETQEGESGHVTEQEGT